MKRLYRKRSSCRASHSANVLNLAQLHCAVSKAAGSDHKNAKWAQSYWWKISAFPWSIMDQATRWCDVYSSLPSASYWGPLQSCHAEGSDSPEGWSEACGKLPASPSPKDSSGCHHQKAEHPEERHSVNIKLKHLFSIIYNVNIASDCFSSLGSSQTSVRVDHPWHGHIRHRRSLARPHQNMQYCF